MKKMTIVFLVLIFFVGCEKINNDIRRRQQRDKMLREQQTPSFQEKYYPLKYLTIVDKSVEGKFFGGNEVKLSILNKAELTTYKDVKIDFIWFSKTDYEISRISKIIRENFKPQGLVSVSFDDDSKPDRAEKYGIQIMSATVVSQK